MQETSRQLFRVFLTDYVTRSFLLKRLMLKFCPRLSPRFMAHPHPGL